MLPGRDQGKSLLGIDAPFTRFARSWRVVTPSSQRFFSASTAHRHHLSVLRFAHPKVCLNRDPSTAYPPALLRASTLMYLVASGEGNAMRFSQPSRHSYQHPDGPSWLHPSTEFANRINKPAPHRFVTMLTTHLHFLVFDNSEDAERSNGKFQRRIQTSAKPPDAS